MQSTLQKLMTRGSRWSKFCRASLGTKEARYAHLLCGQKPEWDAPQAPSVEARADSSGDSERLTALEEEISALRKRWPTCARKSRVSENSSSKHVF